MILGDSIFCLLKPDCRFLVYSTEELHWRGLAVGLSSFLGLRTPCFVVGASGWVRPLAEGALTLYELYSKLLKGGVI